MIKKIMVPIAFSKYSKGILDYAAGLAEPLAAELLVVNVINQARSGSHKQDYLVWL